MPTRTISLKPENGPQTITSINCGSSSPRLGGTINLASFPNLESFTCTSNDITSITGFNNLLGLKTVTVNNNKITGAFPDLSNNTALTDFNCGDNLITGTLPSLASNVNLVTFACNRQIGGGPTSLGGQLPNLSLNTKLTSFNCNNNRFSGSIPALPTSIRVFAFSLNQFSGSIPNLDTYPNLEIFDCNNNDFTGFTTGATVTNKLGNFNASTNKLTTSAVNAILAAFVAANRTTGTRILNLGGRGNAVPSSDGVTTTSTSGANFSRSGILVTVNLTSHGYVNGDWVTITGITETAFQGTFVITKVSDNVFTYNTSSTGTITAGSGTAALRKTSTGNTSGFRSYQNLALVSRTGGPWTIIINFPT